jgi:UDP-glucuronate 4-epimerase
MSKTVLITGLAGFIGFNLAKKLKSLGYDVIGFDNFNDYYDVNLKKERAKELQKHGIWVDKIDLKAPARVDAFIGYYQPDVVMHLAAYAGVRHSMDNPDEYIHTNIVGTHNLIQSCRRHGVQRIVYASTSCTMAGNELPWKNDEKLGYQLNPYGYSKATNEAQFMASHFDSAIGLRFFTVYGPWGRPDMALFTFTKNILEGKPIQLYNNGNMIRDFTYVDDIVSGIVIAIERALSVDEKQVYNIGFGQQVKLMDFVSEIEKNVGKEAIKEFVPKHPADTQETWSDTSKLQALGYKPTTPVTVGVQKFVEWYRNYYKV